MGNSNSHARGTFSDKVAEASTPVASTALEPPQDIHPERTINGTLTGLKLLLDEPAEMSVELETQPAWVNDLLPRHKEKLMWRYSGKQAAILHRTQLVSPVRSSLSPELPRRTCKKEQPSTSGANHIQTVETETGVERSMFDDKFPDGPFPDASGVLVGRLSLGDWVSGRHEGGRDWAAERGGPKGRGGGGRLDEEDEKLGVRSKRRRESDVTVGSVDAWLDQTLVGFGRNQGPVCADTPWKGLGSDGVDVGGGGQATNGVGEVARAVCEHGGVRLFAGGDVARKGTVRLLKAKRGKEKRERGSPVWNVRDCKVFDFGGGGFEALRLDGGLHGELGGKPVEARVKDGSKLKPGVALQSEGGCLSVSNGGTLSGKFTGASFECQQQSSGMDVEPVGIESMRSSPLFDCCGDAEGCEDIEDRGVRVKGVEMKNGRRESFEFIAEREGGVRANWGDAGVKAGNGVEGSALRDRSVAGKDVFGHIYENEMLEPIGGRVSVFENREFEQEESGNGMQGLRKLSDGRVNKEEFCKDRRAGGGLVECKGGGGEGGHSREHEHREDTGDSPLGYESDGIEIATPFAKGNSSSREILSSGKKARRTLDDEGEESEEVVDFTDHEDWSQFDAYLPRKGGAGRSGPGSVRSVRSSFSGFSEAYSAAVAWPDVSQAGSDVEDDGCAASSIWEGSENGDKGIAEWGQAVELGSERKALNTMPIPEEKKIESSGQGGSPEELQDGSKDKKGKGSV